MAEWRVQASSATTTPRPVQRHLNPGPTVRVRVLPPPRFADHVIRPSPPRVVYANPVIGPDISVERAERCQTDDDELPLVGGFLARAGGEFPPVDRMLRAGETVAVTVHATGPEDGQRHTPHNGTV